jgi:hypothetical protein
MPGYDPERPPLPERATAKMTSEQYLAAIKRLGLSQVRAARFFGASDRQGQRIARGEAEMPPPVAHLLKLMLKHHVMPGDLDPDFR